MGVNDINDYEHFKLIPAFQSWIRTQQHLPQNIDVILVQRYLHSVHGDLDKAKKLIEHSFQMRNNHPNIFFKRDPLSKESKNIIDLADMMPLPYATKENYKVILYRLVHTNADKFNFLEAIRMFFMVADVRLVATGPEEPNSGWNGEVPVFDMTGFTLRHLACVVLSVLRVYMKYTQEAHPVRLRSIHVINCSPYLDKVMALVRPFMRKEVAKLLHFHKPGSDTFNKFVPKDLMPTEYGGKAGDVADLKQDFLNKVIKYRDYIMDESRWKLNTTKKSCGSAEQEITGNFRTLCID